MRRALAVASDAALVVALLLVWIVGVAVVGALLVPLGLALLLYAAACRLAR